MAPPSKKSQNRIPNASLKAVRKPFKSKTKTRNPTSNNKLNDSVATLPLQLEDDVPDFPRGGGSLLSRKERNGDGEAEANGTEVRVLKNKSKDRNARNKNKGRGGSQSYEDDDLGSLFGDGISGKLPRFANRITLKNISPGMKLWGVIAEVNEKDIVVSLPGGLRGLVRASEAFDSLRDDEHGDADNHFLSTIFSVGQLVSCAVLELDDDKKEAGKRKVWLSLRLSLLHKSLSLDIIQEGMVLSAYVKSIEDHGYMLDFGLLSFTGFMTGNNQSETRLTNVNFGQLLQGVVRSIDKTRKVIYLSSDPDMVAKSVTKDLKGISIDLLVPGMLVNARIRSTLENGIMLSFLTYFTGTVDVFNLQKTLPTSSWKDEYVQNKKVTARILFIDPVTRAVGLTLNPHLVQNRSPPMLVKTGDIFDQSKVVRVDKGSGLLLEIPSSPIPTPAFVSVSDVADKEVKRLEKSFKEGSPVRVRILGFKLLEGLATGTLKTSAFEGSVFTHSDVKPGMVVKGKVIAVDSFGAIVQFAGGIKALCPLRHMSEFEIAKPRKKFQVGTELVFSVLGCKSKRITVTHKKTLVKSKLDILSSYADASEGLITHGWITKIENHGCFVHFYNGVQGFAPKCELGLDPGCDISSMYHVEQVVKCRVTSSLPASKRINLSFTMTPARSSEKNIVKLGSIVSGIVERVTPSAVVVDVNAMGHTKGTISPEHLSDHQGQAALIKSLLKPGHEFDQLLILDAEGSNLILTAKYSLIRSAQQLPLDVNQVVPKSVVHGYICNIIETGCFVRFAGRLTGFAPRNKATDDRRSDLLEVFDIGQSVRTSILDVSSQTGRITVSLKQSLCCSTDASFIDNYFVLEDKICKLQLLDSDGSELGWLNEFGIGDVVEGKIHETKDFGVVISFQNYADVFGFISLHQLGGITVEMGSIIRAAVLDVSKAERLVDLSLKPEFVNRSSRDISAAQGHKKKRKREADKQLKLNQTVNAVVEIVKDNYVVLSIPEYNFMLGYASLVDYNTQKLPPKVFINGQSVIATVVALPSTSTSERLLLLLKSLGEVTETSSSKRAKRKSSYDVGSLVQAEITEMKPLEVRLKFGPGLHGRVHITEAADDIAEDPFGNLRIGQTLTARIVSKGGKSASNKKSCQWELSIKPSVLQGTGEIGDESLTDGFNYSTGQYISGFVYKVDNEWAWLTVTRHVRAQLYILDSSCDPSELKKFQKQFCVGKGISGYVLSASKEKKLLRLVLHPLLHIDRVEDPTCHIHEGSVVGGRISKILPGVNGMLVQIDTNLYGKVHFTELTDLWVSDPLSGFHEGQFVKCKVLDIGRSFKGTMHVDLSLRLASGDTCDESRTEADDNVHSPVERVEKMEDLQSGMIVKGYVKNVSPKGCFILLSRKVDAKILLSNLSDGYIESPEKEFPVGKLVTGRVVSVEPLSKRVEVTLRTQPTKDIRKPDRNALTSLKVGDIISGRIKRMESYGLFITVDHTNMVGLCHVSQLSDDHVDNLDSLYKAGDRVKAKILKVDKERCRISLGMKNSYLAEDRDNQSNLSHDDDHVMEENGGSEPNESVMPSNVSTVIERFDSECEDRKELIYAEAESRADIPPLEVTLDDIEGTDDVERVTEDIVHGSDANAIDERNKKRAKKKAKEEREREIRAAEERLLEVDIPRSADEFEKLIRKSPNTSYFWIQYMAYMLSVAEVEKARSIAERALRTINIREESEKRNVWIAYLNLESKHGNPPEEAVVKVFQRALQYCDPKKIHLDLLNLYERSEQHKLAGELLDKMVRKFKNSCKVWLRQIERLLKTNHEGVQSVVNRALLSLPRHKHIKFISHAAILEFKCGVPDRGRSLFERMLREYPKRTDLWSIYLDQEICLGDDDVTRALFERAISLSLPPKKMKFLFNKYLKYEKSKGDEERIESVKRKAMEYVESTLA